MAGTKLSILITYYNEGVGLAETLKSLVIPPELELEILIFESVFILFSVLESYLLLDQ